MSRTETSPDAFDEAQSLQAAGEWAAAATILERLARERLTVNIAINLGICLFELGQYGVAEHWLHMAARNRPADPGVRQRLANLYAAQGRIHQAELEYRTALAFQPDYDYATLSLGGLLLSVGRYPEGWPMLEPRVRIHPEVVPPIKPSFPEWTGQPLAGKSVLIWVEQGFGDQIQFSRFVNPMKALGASRITLACRPPLAHLFSTLAGADEILSVAAKTDVAVGRHDYWSRYFSLPRGLGTTLDNLPAAPYLSAPADRRDKWRGMSGIGLTWKASPTGFNARNKGLPAQLAGQLLEMGCISLDPDDTGAQDFADTAAIIEQLDLVISIDTSVAHLAGAMGKPCWTLLPFLHTDWRWMRNRSDSPWYPSLRLYRQTAPGDWSVAADQVMADLTARLESA